MPNINFFVADGNDWVQEEKKIKKSDVKEILSEIDVLDKQILETGKLNVNIEVAEFNSESVCLIHLKKLEAWIPITELGKLHCRLMQSIYKDYERKIVETRGNGKDKVHESSGVYEENNKYKKADNVWKDYKNWVYAVKRQQKALRIEEAHEKAKDSYQKVKQTEDLYNSEIKHIVTVFSAIIPDLACFAGCRTSELYPDIAASLENKRRHLKAYLYQNNGVLDDLKEISSFPDLKMMQTDSDMKQNEMEANDVNAEIPEEFREFIEKLNYFFDRKGIHLDNGNCDEEFYSIWNPDDAFRAVNFFCKDVEKRNTTLTQEEEKDKGEEIRIYRTEAEKIRKRILSYEKPWSYAQLFCMVYPIVKEIDEYQKEEMDADWCKSISERLYQLLEDFNKESVKYRFRWISYNDKECMESESIKVNFIAGEARWPGLYLCYEDDNCQKHLICVTPGSALGV